MGILHQSKMFERAMVVFMISIALFLSYALWRGSSFFSAFVYSVNQFPHIMETGDRLQVAPFINGVVASWDQRLAAYPPTLRWAAAIFYIFLIGGIVFRMQVRSPKGAPVEAVYQEGSLARSRIDAAKRLAGFDGPLYERTDNGQHAVAKGNAVYLPPTLTQALNRRLAESSVQKLAFVIVHERAHASSLDNFLWSFGHILTRVLTGVAIALLSLPIWVCASILVLAGIRDQLPEPLIFLSVTLFGGGVLALLGVAFAGFLPNVTAIREFFADRIAALTVGGADAFPYVGATDPNQIDNSTAGWRMGSSAPDRRLHVMGYTPRTGALAASAVTMWFVVRTAVLLLDSQNGYWLAWVVDVICLGALGGMLSTLPPQWRGIRDYGTWPWAATTFVALSVPAAFAVIDLFLDVFDMARFIPLWWLVEVAALPLMVIVALIIWRRATAIILDDVAVADRHPVDSTPPPGVAWGRILRRMPMVVIALPAYVSSYVVGAGVLFMTSTACGGLTVGQDEGLGFNVISITILAINLATLYLVVKNLIYPTKMLIAAEIFLTSWLIGIISAFLILLTLALIDSPPNNIGGAFSNDEVMWKILSESTALYVSFFLFMLIISMVILSISWWARYQLFKRTRP